MLEIVKQLLGIAPEIVRARTDLKTARIEAEAGAIRQAMTNEAGWEQLAAQNAATSWLDEYWTVVLSVPVIMCFVPALSSLTAQGFENLELTPDWFKWCIGASISFAFARKAMPKIGKRGA